MASVETDNGHLWILRELVPKIGGVDKCFLVQLMKHMHCLRIASRRRIPKIDGFSLVWERDG